MSQQNKTSSCFNQAIYDSDENTLNIQKQLEKWNKVRQSLYSLGGWCSDNVNQISRWDVGDLSMKGNIQEHSFETGTNNWLKSSLSSSSIVPDSPQTTEWKNNGAIPKMFNLENLNCLRVNATNVEYPYSAAGRSHQIKTNVFHGCDTIKPKDSDLHLQMETLNLNTEFPDEMELTLGT